MRGLMDGICAAWVTFATAICGCIAISLAIGLGTQVGTLIDDIAQYWYAIFGAFAGTALATAASAIATHFRKKKAVKELIRVIEHNQRLLSQMIRRMSHGGSPNFLLDTAAMDIWLAQTDGILGESLVTQVTDFRYQLDHINSKFQVYYGVLGTLSITSPAISSFLPSRKKLTLLLHCGQAKRWSKGLLSALPSQ